MIYREVVQAGLILPKKQRYTARDTNAVLLASLFRPYMGRTLTTTEAAFVVRCSAIFHGTEYSRKLIPSLTQD